MVSGRGTVWSWTVVHQPFADWLKIPYVCAVVAIDEDPTVHLTTRLVGLEPSDVAFDMPVEVVFEPLEWAYLPLFRPRRHA